MTLNQSLIYSVYFLQGYSKYKLGLHEAAIADFDLTLRLNPDHAQSYIKRGDAKIKLKHYKDAIVDFDKGLQT